MLFILLLRVGCWYALLPAHTNGSKWSFSLTNKGVIQQMSKDRYQAKKTKGLHYFFGFL